MRKRDGLFLFAFRFGSLGASSPDESESKRLFSGRFAFAPASVLENDSGSIASFLVGEATFKRRKCQQGGRPELERGVDNWREAHSRPGLRTDEARLLLRFVGLPSVSSFSESESVSLSMRVALRLPLGLGGVTLAGPPGSATLPAPVGDGLLVLAVGSDFASSSLSSESWSKGPPSVRRALPKGARG